MIRWISSLLIITFSTLSATFVGPAEIGPRDVVRKSTEMMLQHPTYHSMNHDLAKRLLLTFCDELDPLKVYLLKSEVADWIAPTPQMLEKVVSAFQNEQFDLFEKQFLLMQKAIQRRKQLDERVKKEAKPEKTTIRVNEFDWVENLDDLHARLLLLRSAQLETIQHLDNEISENALNRLQKQQLTFEQQRQPKDPTALQQTISTFIMKAFAESLDSQTAFFTPAEAKQLLISMQQRLFGIGVLLRDDTNGFTVIKIVEGGPAERQGGLILGDKIIAVNNESVIGLDMLDVVEIVRGEPGSHVHLKALRKNEQGEISSIEIDLRRGEVVVKDLRYGSQTVPFGDGVIAYLRLHSFYQDSEASSYSDLLNTIEQLKKKHLVKGIILDLRCNPGGLLTQAVAVSSLFLNKGIIVSIQEDENLVTHLRNLNYTKAWNGPLIVLINRGSASAAEIVAQTLQDWGRAIVVGDDTSYGKGSFQLFTLSPDGRTPPNPKGEYKVTRGRYYTVSGKSPQLTGVHSDIVVPGVLSFAQIGEQYTKFPLASAAIPSNFEDTLSDIPCFQRPAICRMYFHDKQTRTDQWTRHVHQLKTASQERINSNPTYAALLNKLKAENAMYEDSEKEVDYQLDEAWNIIKDLSKLSEETVHEEAA